MNVRGAAKLTGAALCAALFVCAAPRADAGMRDGERSLIQAVVRGDAAGAAKLLASGIRADLKDDRGRPLVLVATHRNDVEVARALILAGADVNVKDTIEDSAFLYAGAQGRNAILQLILQHGKPDFRTTNRYGGTALIPAAHYGHVETVRILLGTPIDKDHVNRLGWTALLEAVILGDGGRAHTEIVRLLVQAGAMVNIPDRDGVTALAHARRRGHAAIVDILQRAGAR